MISVIIPVYNVGDYINKCLASLAEQTMDDCEFIVIDDGSTDNSRIIIDEYCKDPRFHCFHTNNRGLSAARNLGIEKAHGEWLMFVDGDDWVEPDFCRAPYRAAMDYEADLIIFQSFLEKKNKTRKIGKLNSIMKPNEVDVFFCTGKWRCCSME